MTEIYLHPEPERLEDFAAGQLDALETAMIEAHLPGCQACGAEVDELRELYATLAALPRLSPTAGFTDRVLAGLDPRLTSRRAVPAWLRPRLTSAYRDLGLLAACLALPVLIGYAALVWWSMQTGITWETLVAFGEVRAFDAFAFLLRAAVGAAMWSERSLGIGASAQWIASQLGPSAIAALAFLAGATSSASAWVLYRNLIRTPTRKQHHARVHG